MGESVRRDEGVVDLELQLIVLPRLSFPALPFRSMTAMDLELNRGSGTKRIRRSSSLERVSVCSTRFRSSLDTGRKPTLMAVLLHQLRKDFCLDAGSSPGNGALMKIWTCYDNLPAQAFYRQSPFFSSLTPYRDPTLG